jgi:hypothetical protein
MPTRHRLAILRGVTHYDINFSPKLATAITRFLEER